MLKHGPMQQHLREHEAAVVENAVRLAIDSIVNVLFGVSGGRNHEYRRMVADRDTEIRRLEQRLREMERELQLLRRRGCACGMFGGGGGGGGQRGPGGSLSSGERRRRHHGGDESGFLTDGGPEAEPEPEPADALPDCEMSFTLGLYARPPSLLSSHSQEGAPLSPPGRPPPEQSCTSRSSEASFLSEAARHLAASPGGGGGGGVAVKEEPHDDEDEAVLVKWELSEESVGEHLEPEGHTAKVERREERSCGERGDVGQRACEADLLRKKKSVPMSELPEEAQRQKRAAWRAASRRYYARKVARQQANPALHAAFLPHMDPQQQQPPPPPRPPAAASASAAAAMERRRRTLISELPQESQLLQREAWRAASRRYYARKVARHRSDLPPYPHMLLQPEPPSGGPDPDRAAAHSHDGGILCS